MTNNRVEQMKQVHIQSDLWEFSHPEYIFSNNIQQLVVFNNELKNELTINKNEIIYPIKFKQDIKSILLTMHIVTSKILADKLNNDKTDKTEKTEKTDKTEKTEKTQKENIEIIRAAAIELFTKKNNDYGDAFAEYGFIGVIVRIGDKIFRLKTLNKTSKKSQRVKDESIKDTLDDLFNYTAMAVMLLEE